ncbi:MAG TPA: hypothetical protein VHL09_13890, partial [Dehalococcoidia bacterium]|nr:hypothetical protein [Dehalococcoidia bacterium]
MRLCNAWFYLATTVLISLVAGCTTQAPTTKPGETAPAAKGAPTTAPPAAQSSPTAPGTGAAAPKVASPAASPVSSPAASLVATGPRAEPKGRVVYSWHTAITPAWFDPQENPALATPY